MLSQDVEGYSGGVGFNYVQNGNLSFFGGVHQGSSFPKGADIFTSASGSRENMDPETSFAKDIIQIVENKFLEGKNEDEIKNFLVSRYGEYILFKPKLDNKNLILWLFPFVLFLGFFVFFIIRLKKIDRG